MDFAVLGWESVAFRLDHRRFAYAGKFVVLAAFALAASSIAAYLHTRSD